MIDYRMKFMFCLFVFVIATISSYSDSAANEDWVDKKFSMEFKSMLLPDIFEKVSKKTGVAIIYDENLTGDGFSGNYTDVTVPEFIGRLLNNYNKVILIEKEKGIIVVDTFGTERFIAAASNQNKSNAVEPFLDGMTQAELKALHAEQYAAYEEDLKNPDSVIPLIGITRGELQQLHEQQYASYQEDVNDPGLAVEGTGMTQGQLRDLQDKQVLEYKKSLDDQSAIVPLVGISQGELKKLHEEQYIEYQKSLNGPNEIVPGLDITRKQLKDLHKEQSGQ